MWKVLWVFPLLLTACSSGPAGILNTLNATRNGRIAGGTEATRNQFPYQVILFIEVNNDQSVCGGSILSPNYVLSAAHCFNSFSSVDVVAGVHNWENDNPLYEFTAFPNDVIVHAQYNRQSQANDIAVVKLTRRPLTLLSSYIEVIPLIPRALMNTNLTGTTGRIAGWGRTSDSIANVSPRLMYIDARIISNNECSIIYGTAITANNICISGENNRSTCQGDSGGPLTILNNGRRVQVGIVSFGSENGCQRGFPTAFTRISSFYTWIQTMTGITVA